MQTPSGWMSGPTDARARGRRHSLNPGLQTSLSGVWNPGFEDGPCWSVVLFPHNVESLGAVFTAIGNRSARFERLVFGQEADQVCSAATLDTGDGLRRPVHSSEGGRAPLSTSTPITPATREPAKMPTLAKSVS